MMERAILFIGLIAIVFCGTVSGGIDKTIKQQKGKTVVLECPIDAEACGDLHSLNWFKGETRIAVMLGGVNVSSVVPEFSERVKLEESPYRLTLNDLLVSDEDVYTCDTTFYIPQESCDATRGYRSEVIVLVPPSDIFVLDEQNEKIINGSVVGPVEEGKTLTAICKVEKTRPQPAMAWYRGGKRLTTHSPSYEEDEDGLFTATLELSLVLSRQDLNNDIECRVESAAIDDIYISLIKLDLQVRPIGIQLDGVGHHTTQGTLTTLSCKVAGARPSANISWTNGTEIIDSKDSNGNVDIRLYHNIQPDGTYDTESQLIFTASRFENDVTFGCDASNIVIKRNNEKPMHAEIPLEVLYPPVVTVTDDDITVNEHKKTTLTCEFIANPASLTGVKWYKNGVAVDTKKDQRFEGGIPDHVPLTILNSHRNDRGNYTCELSNAIGTGNSSVNIQLDVLYVPSVEVIMIPKGPVKENDEVNVTLYCNITDANPWSLTKVRWFANSTLLKELPDCSNQAGGNNNNEDLCNIDPSKLLLESVGRGFAYNYSCEGYNTAGWGNRSEEDELIVFHEPGPAKLSYYPLTVVKKQSVTFSCSVDVPGVPEATQYRWFRGGQGVLIDVYKKDWTVELVGLDSRTNFSCFAYNDGGKGQPAVVNLDVKAPPFFIKNLVPYTGVLYSTKNASLTCRVECVPRCKINWFKDGIGIYANDSNKYVIHEEYLPENPATGDFESVISELNFNMSAWPIQQFDIHHDNANYSCVASENEVGPGVRSATYLSIEYQPENTTVSHDVVNVTENTAPKRILCSSKANPDPSYEWRLGDKLIVPGNALMLVKPMLRNESGHYKCIAFNKHGSNEATTYINVQYKPSCDIDRKMVEDQDTLICTAFGNPEEFGFVWSIKTENDSVEVSSGSIEGDKAYLPLTDDFTITRTYRCVANNTIGEGHFCEIEVAGQLAWWQRWDRTTLIIVCATVCAILLAVIIICCIIICICRRRRRQDKYNTAEASICATQSVLSYQASTPLPPSSPSSIQITSEIPKSPPKWPLRPGVMVHVKNDTKKNLCANRNIQHKRSLSFSNQTTTTATITTTTNKITQSTINNTLTDNCNNEINNSSDGNSIIKTILNKSAPNENCTMESSATTIPISAALIQQLQNVNKPNENSNKNAQIQNISSLTSTAPPTSPPPPPPPLSTLPSQTVPSTLSDSIQIECNNNSVGIQTEKETDKLNFTDKKTTPSTTNEKVNVENEIENNNEQLTMSLISSSSYLLENSMNSNPKVHIASPFKTIGTTTTTATIFQPQQPPPPPPPAPAPAPSQPTTLLQSNNQLKETTISIQTITNAQKNDQKSLPRNIKSPSKSLQTTIQAVVRVNPNNTIPTDTPNREFLKAVIKPTTTATTTSTTAVEKLRQSYKLKSMKTTTTSVGTSTEFDEIKPLASSSPCKPILLESTNNNEHNKNKETRQISFGSTTTPLPITTSTTSDIPPKLPRRNVPPRPPPPAQISLQIAKKSSNNSHLDAINSSINLTNELPPSASSSHRSTSNNSSNTFNANLHRKGKIIGGAITSTSSSSSSKTTATTALVSQCELASDEEYEDDTRSITKSSIGEMITRKGRKNSHNLNTNDIGLTGGGNGINGSCNGSNSGGGGSNLPSPRNIGGNLFEKIFSEIFSKRNNNKNNHDDLNSLNSERSENRLLRYFGMSKVFKRQRLQRNDSCSSSNPFTIEHRLKGLRSSGSVTYKKTPVLERAAQQQSKSKNKFESEDKITTTNDDNYALIELNEHDSLTERRNQQIHDKSSTLADPLTEPGEYENLPFHGLQQPPQNKFITTPINFNNNTNVVRVAPRPKITQTNHHQQNINQFHQIFNQQQQQQQLDQNLSSSNNQNNYHQKSIQFPNQNQHQSQQQQQQQQQQQLHYQIQQQYSPADCYTNSLKLIQNKSKMKNLNYGSSTLKLEKRKPIIGVNSNNTAGDNNYDITRTTNATSNLENRFPTSYTEYFQQQKFSDIISDNQNDSIINNTALNPNYPYSVVENGIIAPTQTSTTQLTPSSSSVSSSRIIFSNNTNSNSTNPFLATNFRKFQLSTGSRHGCGTITANHRKKQHGNSNNSNTIVGNSSSSGEKKFYSLKALKNKNNLNFSSIKPSGFLSNSNSSSSNSSNNNKCKRHHSFAGGSFADVINGIDINNSIDATTNNLPYTMQPKIKFYEPPTYENLTDSIQIHESPSENLLQHTIPDSIQHQQQQQTLLKNQQLISHNKTKTSTNKLNHHTIASATSLKLNNSLNGGGGNILLTSSTITTAPVGVGGGIGNQYIIQKNHQHQKHSQHHQTQRQKMNDDNTKKHLMEPERMSIYRSDSGISNSSYECVTPIAPPRQYNLLDDDIIDTTSTIQNDLNNDDDDDDDDDIDHNHHHFGDAIDKCNPDVTMKCHQQNRIDKLYNSSAINNSTTTSTTSTSLSSYNNSINNRKLLENDFDRLNIESNNTYNNSLLNPELSHHYLNNPKNQQYNNTSNSNQKNQKISTTNTSTKNDANILITNTNDFATASNTTNKTNITMHDGSSVKCQNKKNDQHESLSIRHHSNSNQRKISSSIGMENSNRSNHISSSSGNKIGSKRRTNTTSPLINSSYSINTANLVGQEQRSINTNPFLVTSPSTTSSSSSSGCISNNDSSNGADNSKSSNSCLSTRSIIQGDEIKFSTLSSSSTSISSISTIRGGATTSGDGKSSTSTASLTASTDAVTKYKKLNSSNGQFKTNNKNVPNLDSSIEKENSDVEYSIITSKSLNAKHQPQQLPQNITNSSELHQNQQIRKISSSSLQFNENDQNGSYLKSNKSYNSKQAAQINNQFYEMIRNRYPGYITKPIKQIPLRKHHSFHFQQQQHFYPNPNTILGQLKLHQIQKEQAKVAAATPSIYYPTLSTTISTPIIDSSSSSSSSSVLKDASNKKNIYKQVGGPLVFRPFLNENTAFKPISPVGTTKSTPLKSNENQINSVSQQQKQQQQYYNNSPLLQQDKFYDFETTLNRYPLIGLKRHTSNIESYDSKRYSTEQNTNTNREEHNILSQDATTTIVANNSINSNQYGGYSDQNDIEDNDDDILMQHDDDANSSASNSTIVGKSLIYVDFDISLTQSDNQTDLNQSSDKENSYQSITNEFNTKNIIRNEQQPQQQHYKEDYDDLTIPSDTEQSSNNKLKSKYEQLFKQNPIENNESPLNSPKLIASQLQQNKENNKFKNKENENNKSLKVDKIVNEKDDEEEIEQEEEDDEELKDICETSSISGIILAKPPTKRHTQYATLMKYNEVKI